MRLLPNLLFRRLKRDGTARSSNFSLRKSISVNEHQVRIREILHQSISVINPNFKIFLLSLIQYSRVDNSEILQETTGFSLFLFLHNCYVNCIFSVKLLQDLPSICKKLTGLFDLFKQFLYSFFCHLCSFSKSLADNKQSLTTQNCLKLSPLTGYEKYMERNAHG